MKYHESVTQANEIMQQVVLFLTPFGLAMNPINYAVAYEHIIGKNQALSHAIEGYCRKGKPLDHFVMESLYHQWLLKHDDLQSRIVDKFDHLLDGVSEHSDVVKVAIDGYVDDLNQGIVAFGQVDHQAPLTPEHLTGFSDLLKELLSATHSMQQNQLQLQQKLIDSHAQTEHLRLEIDDLNKKRTLDTLTGLQTMQVLRPQMEVWLQQHPKRKIAAIAMDIDHFRQFNESYGHVVGDVILTKIARKISHYVAQSGLPVRTGGEEFLILLPDVDLQAANEVAEQVRQGVEKMKFVSARSKRALPCVTISVGTASYRSNESMAKFIGRADSAMLHAKNAGRNRVSCETTLA